MGSKGSQTTTQNTATSADPMAMTAYENLLNRAGSVATTPYQAYGGEGVAGVNQQQNLGIGGTNQFANAAQPGIAQGMAQTQASSAPLSASAIQQYMSPYTQNVVDATQAQFNDTNAQQLNQVRGNAVAQGAMGGNREGVAETTAFKNANIAQNPVIAGLYNQGYGQAVNTATQQQQIGLQGAGQMGNLGVAGQTAGLQGAGAQIGAGTLQQNTQQALDNYLLQQFQQQQAFPYQQAQWLAGIDTGVGSQMGGTSTGATTAPAPNQTAQYLGLGMAGTGFLLSDARDKHDIRHVGHTHDGQRIYSFKYKGDHSNTTHMGLIAQEVEQHKPHAVHEIGGHKIVDYDAATRARGGVVPGFATGGMPGTPYGNVQGYIPQVSGIAHGSGPPRASAPTAPGQPSQDMSKQMSSIGNLANQIKSSMNGSSSILTPGSAVPDAFSSTSVGGPQGPMPLVPMYGRGGVAGYDDGGTVINPDDPYRMPDAGAVQAWRKGVDADTSAGQTAQDQPEDVSSKKIPVSQGVAPSRATAFSKEDKSDTSDLPSEVALGYSSGHPPVLHPDGSLSEYAPTSGKAGLGVASATSSSSEPNSSGFFDKIGDRIKTGLAPGSKFYDALIPAGLGMMASRSPNLGVAIGEGGQAGFASYGEAQKREFEAEKVAQQLQHQSREESRQERAQKMQEEQNRQTNINRPVVFGPDGKPMINPQVQEVASESKTPFGWQTDENGVPHYVPGGPADPDYLKKAAEARAKVPFGWMQDSSGNIIPIPNGPADPDYKKRVAEATKGSTLPEDTARSIARYTVATGDDSRQRALGFNGANKALVQKYIDEEKEKNGIDDTEYAKRHQDFAANQTRLNAGARTQATREENLNMILKATSAAVPAALEESAKVKRYTGIVPFDSMIQKGQLITNDPNLVTFGMANLQLAEHWARAMNPMGVMRESDRDLALHFLDTAFSGDTYEIAVKQLQKQITRERDSIKEGKTTVPTDGRAVPGADTPTHGSPLPKTDSSSGGGRKAVRQGTVNSGPNAGKTVIEYSDGTREYK